MSDVRCYEQFLRLCFDAGKPKEEFTGKAIYNMYLKTTRWEQLRNERMALDQHECRMCDSAAQVVHHRHYKKPFGQETMHDLTSLCHRCHKNHHVPPSIEEIRRQFEENSNKDQVCPCCFTAIKKKRKRYLYSTLVHGLVLLDNFSKTHPDVEWVHAERLFKKIKNASTSSRGDFAKLRYWGFVELKTGTSGKSRSGLYKITARGREFVNGIMSVSKAVWVHRGKLIEWEKETVTLQQALGVDFDLNEVLSSTEEWD